MTAKGPDSTDRQVVCCLEYRLYLRVSQPVVHGAATVGHRRRSEKIVNKLYIN